MTPMTTPRNVSVPAAFATAGIPFKSAFAALLTASPIEYIDGSADGIMYVLTWAL
jgi:hypothetical protein